MGGAFPSTFQWMPVNCISDHVFVFPRPQQIPVLVQVLQFSPVRLLRQELHFQIGLTAQTPNLICVCVFYQYASWAWELKIRLSELLPDPNCHPLQSDSSQAVPCAGPRMDQGPPQSGVRAHLSKASSWFSQAVHNPSNVGISHGLLSPFQSSWESEHPSAWEFLQDTAGLMHESSLWNNSENKLIWVLPEVDLLSLPSAPFLWEFSPKCLQGAFCCPQPLPWAACGEGEVGMTWFIYHLLILPGPPQPKVPLRLDSDQYFCYKVTHPSFP